MLKKFYFWSFGGLIAFRQNCEFQAFNFCDVLSQAVQAIKYKINQSNKEIWEFLASMKPR